MAGVYDVIESTQGNDVQSTVDDKGSVTYTTKRTFTIALDDGTSDDSITVKINAAIPQENDTHPSSNFLSVNNVSVTRKSVIFYEAVVSYSSPPIPQGSDPDDQPWELPYEITFGTVTTEEAIDEDADGEAIDQDGTDELIEGVTRPISDLSATVTKNMLVFNPTSIFTYVNAVNSDTFLTFPAGTVRIESIGAKNAIKENIPYWVVTVQFVFRKPYNTTAAKSWYKRIRREGYYYLDGSDVERAMDNSKPPRPVVKPVLLAADGTRLALGGTALWKEFRVFDSTAFSGLGL